MGCVSPKAAVVDTQEVAVTQVAAAVDIVKPPLDLAHSSARSECDFVVEFNRDETSGEGVGVLMKCVGRSLLICKVQDHGSVGRWNAKNPSREVRPGDKVVRVNGVSQDISKMTELMCQHGAQEWHIVRKENCKVFHRQTKNGPERVLASELAFEQADGLREVAAMPDDSVCAICMEGSEVSELRLVQLPCHHVFHASCLMTWFQKGAHRCPLCNQTSTSGIIFTMTQPKSCGCRAVP